MVAVYYFSKWFIWTLHFKDINLFSVLFQEKLLFHIWLSQWYLKIGLKLRPIKLNYLRKFIGFLVWFGLIWFGLVCLRWTMGYYSVYSDCMPVWISTCGSNFQDGFSVSLHHLPSWKNMSFLVAPGRFMGDVALNVPALVRLLHEIPHHGIFFLSSSFLL